MAKLTTPKAILMYVLAAFFLFFEMGVQVSPSIMTDSLMSDFNINIFWLGLMSGAYFITYTAMQIPAGLFYDRFSVKSVIVVPLAICTLGGFIFALAPNVYFAAAARIFMGFGSAFAFIGVLSVASEVFSEKRFALVVGITQMLAALGAMCGELPLVPMVHHFGWRVTMALVSCFGVVLVIAILLFMRIPQSRAKNKTGSDVIVGLKRVLKNPQSWIIALYACLLWAPMAAVASLYGPPFVQSYFGLTLASAATVIVMMWIGIAVGSPFFGFFSDHSGNRKKWLIIPSLIGVVAFGLMLFIPVKNITLLIALFLFAGAACAGQALSFALVRDNSCEQSMATAIGFNNMAVVLAGFVFQPLVGFVIQKTATHIGGDAYHYTASSYHSGMLVILGCYVLSALVAIFLICHTPKHTIAE